MRVTKFVHSCLLVEHEDKAVLIDPGAFSWSKIDPDLLPKLDAVLITHKHPDHFNPEALRSLRAIYPELPIVTNSDVLAELQKENIEPKTQKFEWIEVGQAPHPVLEDFIVPCKNSVFNLFGILTDPGDSYDLKETCEVLALPITAPWGSAVDAIKLGLKLKPKTILPIHDAHWHDESRAWHYASAQRVFQKNGIQFIPLETGVSVDLDN